MELSRIKWGQGLGSHNQLWNKEQGTNLLHWNWFDSLLFSFWDGTCWYSIIPMWYSWTRLFKRNKHRRLLKIILHLNKKIMKQKTICIKQSTRLMIETSEVSVVGCWLDHVFRPFSISDISEALLSRYFFLSSKARFAFELILLLLLEFNASLACSCSLWRDKQNTKLCTQNSKRGIKLRHLL